MKTKSILIATGLSAASLLFVSCDSKQEQAREEALEQKAENLEASADQLRKDGEKVAELKESHADAIRDGREKAAYAVENSADATREAVEKRADELEEEADATREAK